MQCRFCKHFEMQGRQTGDCTAIGALVQSKWQACKLFTSVFAAEVLSSPAPLSGPEESLILPELNLRKLLEEMAPEPSPLQAYPRS